MHFALAPLNSQASPSGERSTDSYFGSSHHRGIMLSMPTPVDLYICRKLGRPRTGDGSKFIASRFMR